MNVHIETKEETATCETHGDYTANFIKFGENWRGGGCPACAEEKNQREAERQQDERREAQLTAFLKAIHLPLRFRDATLANYRPTIPHAEKVLDACRRYVDSFEERYEQGSSMVLCGGVGTGKTHLAAGIAQAIVRKYGYRVCYMTVMQAVRSIRETYGQNASETETEAFSRLASYPLLILDEAGVQLGSNHEHTALFEIINRRYGDMMPTILISNLGLTELTAIMGERLIDRLRENGAVLTFTWASYRGNAA